MNTTTRTSRLSSGLSDAGFLVIAVVGLPLWAFLLLVFGAVVVARHLYWWARANTTATSRVLESSAPVLSTGTRTS